MDMSVVQRKNGTSAPISKASRSFRGERLRFLRDQLHLSQPELEVFLGFGSGTISRYEHGLSDPSPNQLVEMSRRLQVSVDWLLGLTDDPEPSAPRRAVNDKSSAKTAKEALFLQRLQRGEFAEIIRDLAQEIILEDAGKDAPENKSQQSAVKP